MPESVSHQPTDAERIARLEQIVYWQTVAWIVPLGLLIAYLIPPIGAVIGLGLLVGLIAGGMVVFIASIVWLLNRTFPNASQKP